MNFFHSNEHDYPIVTIIVPVYNVEKYLLECLESILNQTFKNYELILVDDGSKEKSGEICDQYQEKHSNIKVLHQTNQGQAAARNYGVECSTGEWIMFVDSDDVIHPDLLSFLYRAVIESNSGMAVSERIKAENIPKDFYQKFQFKYSSDIVSAEKLKEYYAKNCFFYWAPFPSLIRKDNVKAIPFPKGRIYEDNAVSCQLVYEAKKLARVPFVMYFYRENPNGTMNQPLTEKKLDYFWALETQIVFFQRIHCKEMCRNISHELLESVFYDYSLCEKQKNVQLCDTEKKYLKRILRRYRSYFDFDKRILRKIDKILRPKIYRVKKRLKVY